MKKQLPPETPPHDASSVVLELDDVTFGEQHETQIWLNRFDCQIRQGELVVFEVQASQTCRPFGSLLQGLVQPQSGAVRFAGEDWNAVNFDRQFEMRSQMGRVFDGNAWLSNLTIDENLWLRPRHHDWDLQCTQKQAHALAQAFNFERVESQRPAFVRRPTLQAHQWIRALLGTPKMIILERPTRAVPTAKIQLLVDAVDNARQSGCAVAWIATTNDIRQVAAETSIQIDQTHDLQPMRTNLSPETSTA